ncbi:UNVERIFIED_CONTAM: hypothetical protein Sindi_1781500 [Sesamum indicum]
MKGSKPVCIAVLISTHRDASPTTLRANHPNFLAIIEEGWNLNVEGTPQFSLCRKLKALKSALKTFNKQHYSHISTRAKEVELALQDAQNQLESNPGDVGLRDSLGDLRKKVVFLAEAEWHIFYQKAKIHYLKKGDHNTKFFHDMVKRNVARNSITAITRVDGTIITAVEDIAQEFVHYYTSLLGNEAHTLPIDDGVFKWGPKLSSEHAVDLFRAITLLEVKETIFHISDNKAPDPNGYSLCFFKKTWDVVWLIKFAGPSWISLGVGRCYDNSTTLSLSLCPNQIIPPLLQTTSRFRAVTSSTRPSEKSSRTGSRPYWST